MENNFQKTSHCSHHHHLHTFNSGQGNVQLICKDVFVCFVYLCCCLQYGCVVFQVFLCLCIYLFIHDLYIHFCFGSSPSASSGSPLHPVTSDPQAQAVTPFTPLHRWWGLDGTEPPEVGVMNKLVCLTQNELEWDFICLCSFKTYLHSCMDSYILIKSTFHYTLVSCCTLQKKMLTIIV